MRYWNSRQIKVGERSGSRVVLAVDPTSPSKHLRFLVRCDCGLEQTIHGTTFRGTTGCKKCNTGGAKRKYGDRVINEERLYTIWAGMKTRCKVVDNPWNARWAGRGITVHEEWVNDFVTFEKWALANGYKDGLTIDRIDVDKNYEPSNCQWITRSENSKRCRAEYVFKRKAHIQEHVMGTWAGILSSC
jgi:hypothetical protein